jgi:hypothetical protein
MTFSGTNGITPSIAGRYRASFLAIVGSGDLNGDGTFHIVQNGVSLGSIFIDMMTAAGVNQVTPFIDIDLVAGQTVTVNYQPAVADSVPFGKGSYFQLSQLPTGIVLDGTVAVADNTTSGYMDIGTMRMQWGTHNDGNVDTTTVTFPVPFANTNYSVVAVSNTSAGSLSAESKTTTTFDIDRASTTVTTQVYSWQAIGLRP